MRLDFESNIASLPFAENGVSDDSAVISNQTKELLREGIKAAQAGSRTTARLLLMRVTELEPRNENAWLWLASISEYPEELLVFLKNVLDINPHNERAVEWKAATKSLLAKTFVQRGIDATKENRMDFSKQCFEQALTHDEKSEMAWLWLASIADSPEEKQSLLEKLLTINPENEAARNALHSLKTQASQKSLEKVNQLAAGGERENASALLSEILENSPELADAWVLKAHLTDSFGEKIKYFERVLEINPEHAAAKSALNSLQVLNQFTVPHPAMPVSTPAETSESEMSGEKSAGQDEMQAADQVFVSEESFAAEESPAAENRFADEDLTADDSFAQETYSDSLPTSELEMPAVSGESDYAAAEQTDEEPSEMQQEESPTAWYEEKDEQSVAETFQTTDSEMPAAEGSADESNAAAFQESVRDDAGFLNYQNQDANELTADQPNVDVETVAESAERFEAENAAVDAAAEDRKNESAEPVFADLQPETVENVEEQEENYSLQTPEDSQTIEYSDHDLHAEENLPEYILAEDQAVAVSENSETEEQKVTEEYFTPQTTAAKPSIEFSQCPFCHSDNESQAFSCRECHSALSLSDLEMLLGNENADRLKLQQVVSRMEMKKNVRAFGDEDLINLGIAHINLKNLRQGFAYLQEASLKNPNNVVLASQVHALAIRLAEIEQREEAADSKPKGKTILVIDDSATVRKLISGKLEKSGHEVVCAVDGMDALAKLNEIVPDLILLDITMPRMDGYQVCKLIRNNETTKNIPVVMISGKDGFFDKVRGRMAGTTGYITKPFGPETLMKALEIYITDEEAVAI